MGARSAGRSVADLTVWAWRPFLVNTGPVAQLDPPLVRLAVIRRIDKAVGKTKASHFSFGRSGNESIPKPGDCHLRLGRAKLKGGTFDPATNFGLNRRLAEASAKRTDKARVLNANRRAPQVSLLRPGSLQPIQAGSATLPFVIPNRSEA